MSTETNVERLREVGLFGGLSDASLVELAGAHDLVDAPPGDAVFHEGDAGREMFIVLDGEIELYRTVRGAERRIALVAQNDWFGEMSLLDYQPRPTSARVLRQARLLRVTGRDLDHLYRRDMKGYALLLLNIAREMSRRLRAIDALTAERDPPPTDGKAPVKL